MERKDLTIQASGVADGNQILESLGLDWDIGGAMSAPGGGAMSALHESV